MVSWNFAARASNHCKSDKEFVEAGSSWCRDLQRMVVRLIVSSTSGLLSARELRASVSVIALLWSLGCTQPVIAQSLPSGGTVASGNVSIGSTSPTSLTVTQSSRTGIVNWSSFSIGQGNQVQFNNGSGATLNRVTGNVPSSINGVLSATGSVYLVNPSGVVVGPSGIDQDRRQLRGLDAGRQGCGVPRRGIADLQRQQQRLGCQPRQDRFVEG